MRTQNPPPLKACRLDSDLGHHVNIRFIPPDRAFHAAARYTHRTFTAQHADCASENTHTLLTHKSAADDPQVSRCTNQMFLVGALTATNRCCLFARELRGTRDRTAGRSRPDAPSRHLSATVPDTGPRSYTDEDASKGSNEARNVTFELMVAERLHTGGLTLDPTMRADVAAKIGNRRLLIECKRPQSEKQLVQLVLRARDQLKRSYASAMRPGCYGLIAFDITKLSNPEFGILTDVQRDEVGAVLTKHIHDLYQEHSSVWARVRDPKTGGVLFPLGVPARLADDTVFTWCQQYAMAVFPSRDPAAVRVAQAVEAAMREATAQEGTLWL